MTNAAKAAEAVDVEGDDWIDVNQTTDETTLSPWTIRRRVKAGTFPAPVRFGPRHLRWRRSWVRAWVAARIAERDGGAA